MANVIWHQIQAAKKEDSDLRVVFWDLVNTFGSVQHNLLWSAFDFFGVPEAITTLVRAYFQDVQLCFTTAEYPTSWQVGIMAGWTTYIYHDYGGNYSGVSQGGRDDNK